MSEQSGGNVPFALGELRGRIGAMERRMDQHESFVRDNFHGFNTKLDDIRITIDRNAGGKATWDTVRSICIGFLATFSGIVTFFVLRAFGFHGS